MTGRQALPWLLFSVALAVVNVVVGVWDVSWVTPLNFVAAAGLIYLARTDLWPVVRAWLRSRDA